MSRKSEEAREYWQSLEKGGEMRTQLVFSFIKDGGEIFDDEVILSDSSFQCLSNSFKNFLIGRLNKLSY